MIRVNRGPEPAALLEVRRRGLERIRDLGRAPTRADVDVGYRAFAVELWRSHKHKCAYCENLEQLKRNDVEHFRPAARADRHPGSSERHGYWWLAWSWDNLLFSCRNCNQAPAKLDKFPLELGSVALRPEEQPPGGELPLILDPADPAVDPRDHLVFRPVTLGASERWQPFARNGSSIGGRTIEVCRLDRSDLVDLYTRHVREVVRPEADRLLALGAEALDREWSTYQRRLLGTTMPFTALACDATEHLLGSLLGGARVEPFEP